MNNIKEFIETHEPCSFCSTKSEYLGQIILDAKNTLDRKLMSQTPSLLFVSPGSQVLSHLGSPKQWTPPANISEAVYVGNITLPIPDLYQTPTNKGTVFYIYESKHIKEDTKILVVALSNGVKYLTSQVGQVPVVDVEIDEEYPSGTMKSYVLIETAIN